MSKKCILVVDDDRRVLNFVRISLQITGYDVLTTTTGEDALSAFESRRPDLVVLDSMVGLDGLEILRTLRGVTAVPVIFFSIDDSVAPEALRLGATQFMSKPFETDDLLARIKELVQEPGQG